jgi:hypothetical protein
MKRFGRFPVTYYDRACQKYWWMYDPRDILEHVWPYWDGTQYESRPEFGTLKWRKRWREIEQVWGRNNPPRELEVTPMEITESTEKLARGDRCPVHLIRMVFEKPVTQHQAFDSLVDAAQGDHRLIRYFADHYFQGPTISDRDSFPIPQGYMHTNWWTWAYLTRTEESAWIHEQDRIAAERAIANQA